MKLLKKIPFFLFLLVLFFCLHGWLQNYGFISFWEVLKPGLLILMAVLFATGICFLIIKNLLYASLIVFFISLWYLFFGAIHDWVKSIALLSAIKSYTVISVLLLLFTIAWIIFLNYKRTLHPKLALYLNVLLLVYCIVDFFLLTKASLSRPGSSMAQTVKFDTTKVTQKPDVYFLLFDGYPGFTSLKDSFNYENDSLQQYFTNNAFKVLPVFANYDLTYFSMSSMFNMQYVKKDFNNLQVRQHDFQKRGVEIDHGVIFPIFRSMGYSIENISIFRINDIDPLSDKNSFLLAHSILLTDKIFHKRLQRDVWLNKIFPFLGDDDFYQHDIDNKAAQELLLKSALKKRDRPGFVYAHFMMPHGPYYYDSLGNKNPFEKISHYTKWPDKELFVSYIKYINKQIIKMTDTIIRHNPEAIIIVMGDHGFRSYNSSQTFQPLRYDNLCAVRFPDNNYDPGSKPWSNVNLFRYVFNRQFAQNLPYLADSSIELRY